MEIKLSMKRWSQEESGEERRGSYRLKGGLVETRAKVIKNRQLAISGSNFDMM